MKLFYLSIGVYSLYKKNFPITPYCLTSIHAEREVLYLLFLTRPARAFLMIMKE